VAIGSKGLMAPHALGFFNLDEVLYLSDLERQSASAFFGDGRIRVSFIVVCWKQHTVIWLLFVGHRKGRGISVEYALPS
jgi:hypothetical protein